MGLLCIVVLETVESISLHVQQMAIFSLDSEFLNNHLHSQSMELYAANAPDPVGAATQRNVPEFCFQWNDIN